MVGLQVGLVESQFSPLVVTVGFEVGDPIEIESLLVRDLCYERTGIGGLFRQPVEPAQLEIVESGSGETLDEQVDVPFAGSCTVGIVVEIEVAAVNLAPVGLSGYGLGQRQYDLTAVERPGDTLAHRAYALVQGGNVASGGEVFVDECDPILLACGGGGISRGVA